ncbi:hypothetical protein CC2G_010192 [Coprinopsis cinerea AmutBmut pab1-1]|nr:hypothetical protein CC2G_010192 [Coprinopsis cinerea AmutBmut pab1-1]
MTLWDSWMGNPRLGATNAMGWNPHAQVFSAKLLGSYNWPFEFALAPMHASFHTESIETRFDLPPSFEEERIHAKVEYQLVLTVEGGNPRTNVRLPIPVHYTPDAPSSGRPQRRPQGMMTPMEDPSAWCALPGVQIEGTVVRRRVHAHASLYVGSSLSYATGSFIPCYITIGVDDPLALDILATSQRLVVKLLRKVTYLQGDPTASSTSYRQAKACFKQAEVISECGRAVWVVPPFAPVEHPRTRQFYGEIHLSEDLKPSYSSPILSISYAIQYLSFDCTAFEQANELKVCGVEITENFTGQHSGGFISRCYSNNDQQVKLKDVQGLPSDFSHFSF